MLTEQQLTSVLATERRIYAALSEVLELTGELSASIQRGDSVSVQLFLQLRQEPVSYTHLDVYKRQIRKLLQPLVIYPE